MAAQSRRPPPSPAGRRKPPPKAAPVAVGSAQNSFKPPAQLARFTAAGAVGVCCGAGVCRRRAQVAVLELFAVVGWVGFAGLVLEQKVK